MNKKTVPTCKISCVHPNHTLLAVSLTLLSFCTRTFLFKMLLLLTLGRFAFQKCRSPSSSWKCFVHSDSEQHHKSLRGPLQSPRDRGPSHPVPWPSVRLRLQSQAGTNTCPVRPTEHAALRQALQHVKERPPRRRDCRSSLLPLFHFFSSSPRT